MDRRAPHEWHVALNDFNKVGGEHFHHWMYDAKAMSTEVPRLKRLFEMERKGELPKRFRRCSISQAEEVIDNHLTCANGVKCRECPFLLALDKAKMSPEDIDEAKAWTCATHLMQICGSGTFLDLSEGWLQTVDDRMFWEGVYQSMSCDSGHPDDATEVSPNDDKASE